MTDFSELNISGRVATPRDAGWAAVSLGEA
jgi:hypothetical protein